MEPQNHEDLVQIIFLDDFCLSNLGDFYVQNVNFHWCKDMEVDIQLGNRLTMADI